MTVLHGTMTGEEVDALRLPLRKKLAAISDFPGHIVAFGGTLGRLATVGQAPLALDVYRWFLATLSPFPVFQQYTLLFTVANGAIAQQTFETYAAYRTNTNRQKSKLAEASQEGERVVKERRK
jgi:hypothetical protein